MARKISEDPYRRGPSTIDLLLSLIPERFTDNQRETLMKAISYFGETPGFSNTLVCLIHSENSDGFFYEIETAVSLHEQGHRIVTFHRVSKVPLSKKKREFDLVTRKGNQEYWVECKTTKWQDAKRLSHQILDQQWIVKSRAAKSGRPIQYQVFSQKTVPEQWQAWFDENGIAVREEAFSNSEAMED